MPARIYKHLSQPNNLKTQHFFPTAETASANKVA
jgi:hypothetical protein